MQKKTNSLVIQLFFFTRFLRNLEVGKIYVHFSHLIDTKNWKPKGVAIGVAHFSELAEINGWLKNRVGTFVALEETKVTIVVDVDSRHLYFFKDDALEKKSEYTLKKVLTNKNNTQDKFSRKSNKNKLFPVVTVYGDVRLRARFGVTLPSLLTNHILVKQTQQQYWLISLREDESKRLFYIVRCVTKQIKSTKVFDKQWWCQHILGKILIKEGNLDSMIHNYHHFGHYVNYY